MICTGNLPFILNIARDLYVHVTFYRYIGVNQLYLPKKYAMKRFLLLCTLLSFTYCLSAQIMVRGGLNYSNISIDSNTDDVVFNSKPGFHLGLNTNIPVGKLWSLRPAALYHLKGAISDDAGATEDTDLSYIEVPVNLGLNIGPLVIEGGPYFGYLLNTSSGVLNPESLNNTDWGANFGVVLELEKLGIGINYSNSLVDIAATDIFGTATDLTNGNLALFLYYRL